MNSTQQSQAAQTQQTLDAQQKLRLQYAVKEFEAVLVGYMLKSMRSSIPKETMFGESYGGDMMEGLFDIELARHVSRGSTLGLGEMLYKEITGEEMPKTKQLKEIPPAAGISVRPAIAKTDSASDAPKHSSPSGISNTTSATGPAGQASAVPDTVRRRVDALSSIIDDAAETHGVDASLLKAVIATESAGRTTAQSSKQAKGLMQLIDSTATAMGVRNVWDPKQNVHGGAKYLSQLLDRFQGNLEHALASYNAGPGAVLKHQGIPPYKETKAYVGKVLEYLRFFEQQEPGTHDED
ncbi:MAG: transglycosylase SLT domain-containing protein [Bacteroidetes bacterium]|nr:transglycosylase SLT domain-containing protein [Bacteroidota bacterium]